MLRDITLGQYYPTDSVLHRLDPRVKLLIILLLITVLINLFMTPGETLLSFWKLKITKEGIYTALFMLFRLVYLIIGSSLMTLTTTPNNLTDGMEKALDKRVDLDVLKEYVVDDFYLKTDEEMYAAFADVPEACENTLRIAAEADAPR